MYFGGGTVAAASADSMFVSMRKGSAQFEDGTPDFLGIASLGNGFDWLERLGGMSAIRDRCREITKYAYDALGKSTTALVALMY